MSYTYRTDKTFCELAKHVIKSEAGFVNDPHDPGGPTKYGVAWNFNADWLKKRGYTAATMKDLTLDDAHQCFYERYWLESNGDGLTDLDLAYEHFDTAINCGVGTAAHVLAGLPVNPKAFDFTGGKNKELGERLLLWYLALRIRYYTHTRRELQSRYLPGWMNRVADTMINCADKIA